MIWLGLGMLALAYVIALGGRYLLHRQDAAEFDRIMAECSQVPEDCGDVLDEGGELRESL